MEVLTLVLTLVSMVSMVSMVSSRPERRKGTREWRAVVPQLLPNYTTTSLPPPGSVVCSQAWLACSYRDGCGLALHQYVSACSEMVRGSRAQCDLNCRLALVALLSTTEGERLMQVCRPLYWG